MFPPILKVNNSMKMNVVKKLTYAFICALLLSACGNKVSSVERPNIVWITSEDNSKHYMELFDENGVKTPNIERLAYNGVMFTHAFSNTPVCSAARSALISGCYGPRSASHYHRKIKKIPMPQDLKMFPAYLRESGYYTTNNAKEDYNFIKTDSVWDESSHKASWRNRKEGQPFFHVFNIGTTHEGRLHFSEKDMKSVNTITDKDSCFIQPNHPQTETFKYTNAFDRDKIMEMDKEVGAVINELKKDSLLENTFIFYFGDHGGVLPGSKGYLKETGLHVPLVIYIPPKYKHLVDAKRGSKIDEFIGFIDFAPTVLNLAGVQIPEEMDGKPFLGKNIKAEESDVRNETYSYADRHDEKYDMVRAIRKGRYKYVRNYNPFNFDGLMNNYRYKQLAFMEWRTMYNNNELNDVQSQFFKPKKPELLFDIELDPFEINNLANDPNYSNTLIEMRKKLNTWVKEMPDLSFFPEHYLIKHAFDNPYGFGQKNKAKIIDYIDIANQMTKEYTIAKPVIEANLKSDDPWKRYWSMIVCSSFGKEANEMIPILKQLTQTDTEYINRVRAAEFLGLVGAENPSEVMENALYETQDEVEALLILNSIVLMQDGFTNYSFDIHLEKIPIHIRKNDLVRVRLMYLKVL